MPWFELLVSQVTDLFRIGLIIALSVTAKRNVAITGQILPLICGIVFVAIIIPVTLQSASTQPVWQRAAVGVVANLIILAGVFITDALIVRLRRA